MSTDLYDMVFSIECDDVELAKKIFDKLQLKWCDVWRELDLYHKPVNNISESSSNGKVRVV